MWPFRSLSAGGGGRRRRRGRRRKGAEEEEDEEEEGIRSRRSHFFIYTTSAVFKKNLNEPNNSAIDREILERWVLFYLSILARFDASCQI